MLHLILANGPLTLGSDVLFSSPGSRAGLEYLPDKRPYPSFALLETNKSSKNKAAFGRGADYWWSGGFPDPQETASI